MKLSAPIHRLKREAKTRARNGRIPLHAALDLVAAEEGYDRWSLMAWRHGAETSAARLCAQLQPGELVLIGARPGQGKTLLAMECAIHAAAAGRPSIVFSLDYTDQQVQQRLQDLAASPELRRQIIVDCSETICATTIIDRLVEGAFVVIDYLQLLDQRRSNPPLTEQVASLRAAAASYGATMLFLSQIDRSFEQSGRLHPELGDVRLPNSLDLSLFDTTWFLARDQIKVASVA